MMMFLGLMRNNMVALESAGVGVPVGPRYGVSTLSSEGIPGVLPGVGGVRCQPGDEYCMDSRAPGLMV